MNNTDADRIKVVNKMQIIPEKYKPSKDSEELRPLLRDLRDTAIHNIIMKIRIAHPAIMLSREFS